MEGSGPAGRAGVPQGHKAVSPSEVLIQGNHVKVTNGSSVPVKSLCSQKASLGLVCPKLESTSKD